MLLFVISRAKELVRGKVCFLNVASSSSILNTEYGPLSIALSDPWEQSLK